MPINALSIGFIYYLAMTMALGISGGCCNPAVGLVQSVYQSTINTHKFPGAPTTSLVYTPAYVFGPFAGAFIAGWFQKLVHEKALAYADEVADEEYAYYEEEGEMK